MELINDMYGVGRDKFVGFVLKRIEAVQLQEILIAIVTELHSKCRTVQLLRPTSSGVFYREPWFSSKSAAQLQAIEA